jgi:hypothetical protein
LALTDSVPIRKSEGARVFETDVEDFGLFSINLEANPGTFNAEAVEAVLSSLRVLAGEGQIISVGEGS